MLVDLARRVSRREPVDVTMGYFNTIWQGDANAMALAALTHASTPPLIVNIAGPEEVSVRGACHASWRGCWTSTSRSPAARRRTRC